MNCQLVWYLVWVISCKEVTSKWSESSFSNLENFQVYLLLRLHFSPLFDILSIKQHKDDCMQVHISDQMRYPGAVGIQLLRRQGLGALLQSTSAMDEGMGGWCAANISPTGWGSNQPSYGFNPEALMRNDRLNRVLVVWCGTERLDFWLNL